MVKKLLFKVFTFWALILTSAIGWGQCPTSVSISADPGTAICAGTDVTFTANIQDNDSYNYQWYVGTSQVGNDTYTYSSSTLSNGSKVKVVVTSADATNDCNTTSNELTMTVNTVRTPTVSITTTKNNICPGESITFNATNTFGGTSPQYAWYINSSSTAAKNGASATFSASDFDEGNNTVRVVLTSNVSCASSPTAEATSATFELKPDASISNPENKDQTICLNSPLQNISFALGGGATNATVTGLPPGLTGSKSGNNFIISGSPTTAGNFSYTVTTSGTCAQTTATGTITVNPNATIALTSGNNTQTVCAAGGVADGSIIPITYSVGETGNDAIASGLPTGITGSFNNGIFTIQGSSSVAGTHNYSVKATETCGDSTSLTGSITITENKTPSVSIVSSDADNTICAETSVTFTASPTNGGSSPTYQWKIDGANAGTNSSTFTTTSLTDGQTVTVEMSSSETCLTTATVTSNVITTEVNPNLTPEVTIEASDSDICPNDSVTFTATPVNGGDNPTYQWKIGNTNAGTNNPTFTTSSLTDGQVVTVIMTSSETCLASATATSNSIETNVNPDLVPSVTISSNDSNNIICAGSNITFTATPVNGGGTPSYQWQINGNASGGVTTSDTFSPNNLEDGDIVTVILISSEECLAENNVTSNGITVQEDTSISGATPVWDNSTASYNPTAICPVVSGLVYKINILDGATSYDWTFPTGWNITAGNGTNEVTVTAGTSAAAGKIIVRGRNECGTSGVAELEVTTGTVVYVEAGPDIEICPGLTTVNLAGEIGGVITKNQDWDWFASVNGGAFSANGFSNGGNSLDGTYTLPTSVRNGGTVTIRIQSIDPAGPCDLKTDERVIKILTAASITDASNKSQTVCLNTEIEDISFNIGGAGKGAEATGLPAGVTGNFANGVYTLSGTPTVAGTFNYTVTTTGNCTNVARSGILTVNQRPAFTQPQEVMVCAGATTSPINFEGSSVTGTTFNWTNDNTAIGLAASGTGNINSFTAVNNTNEPLIANIKVTPVANNCEGTPQDFQITVYPTSTFTTPEDLTVCNGENLDEITFGGSNVSGSIYRWSNSNTSIGLAAEGTGNISSFSATNTTNAPIEATITVTPVANGCDGTPQQFTITVNPTPAFTAPENIVVCNGEDLSQINFTGATVAETSYSWTNSNVAIGLSASATETGFLPSFTALNNGIEPVNAIITVTPSGNGCGGEPVTFQITVNPTPEVNPIDDAVVCNGEDVSEIILSSNVTGTSVSWTNSNPAIGLSGSGTGNLPAFSAENTTDQPVTATITVTPTANECDGTLYTFEITVNPSATVEAGPDQTICSNGVATMAAILGGGATEGTWTTNGSGTFNNNTISAEYTPSDSDALNGSVILTYTSNDPDGPCAPAADTLELVIKEEVKITTEPENIGVCSTEPSELTVIASGDNLFYEWKRTDGDNITNSNGIYSSTLSFNNTTSTNAGEYYVVVKGEDACNDDVNPVESARVTINVDENIIIEEPVTEVPICGDGFSEVTMKFIAHANGSPLTFTWYKDNVAIDPSLDSNITITTGVPDENGKYEGTLHLANITTAYNGDYFVEINGPEEFTCSTAVTNPFQLRLNDMPALPEIQDLVICQNETPEAFIVTTGTNLKWYLNEEDTEFIVDEAGQPTTPVPPTDAPGDFYYWVTQQPAACESEKVQVKVTVKEKPTTPTLTAEEALIEYCLGESAFPLTATGTNGATFNWYDSQTGEALASAPTPNTESPLEKTYWVSQTPNDGFGCESDRAEILVKVYALPEVAASVREAIICLGSPAELSATGGVSYIWNDGEEVIGNEASISHTPLAAGDYTFTVLVTDANGCENTAKVDVQVDENTVAGTISGPERVCINSPSGSFILEGKTGEVQRWESSTDNGANWTEITNTSSTFEFTNLSVPTIFRAVVKNGVCDEMTSNQIEVTIDELPVGGELNFAGNGRVFTICENPVDNYAVDLNLSGKVGNVVRWGYRNWDVTGYTDLKINGELFTGTTLTAAQIQGFNFNETTVFQVEISNGACAGPAYSKTAILSVIPSDITPSPVEVDPEVVCLGEEVTLSSETGYETGGTFLDQGAFDNASITNHGWRIRREGISGDLGFDTDANNTEFDRWKRATPRAFTTASINSPYNTSGVLFDTGIEDGNKGFALISGNYRSTMETPVFTIGSTDQAILTFDQAYVLTPGSSLKVEISTDGGSTYTTLYIREVPATATQGIASGNTSSFGTGTIDSHPENKILIDLGDYMGRPNLRIRFNYTGARSGDIWAVDNIDIPEGPNGITMEWRDYTDSTKPEGVLIGTNNTEKWAPTKIGLNIFEVKTKLVYNSNGDACETAENAERVEVFVFDKYTTNVIADYGSCGVYEAKLTATVLNGRGEAITNYPTPDGYIGKWKLEGNATLVDSNPNDGIAVENDPNAILSTGTTGTYTVSWVLEPTIKDENGNLFINPEACPPVINPSEVVIEGCTALDFDGFNDYVDLGTNYTGSNYSIEAWIRPFDRELEAGGQTDANDGTIISGPGFEIKMQDMPAAISPNGRWYHIAYTNDGKLYVDGIVQNTNSINGVGGSKTLIGARWNSSSKEAENHFSGWIEELRIWNSNLSQEQIRFMMNQRIKINNTATAGSLIEGEVVPNLVLVDGISSYNEDGIHNLDKDGKRFYDQTWGDLAGYYRLYSANPDPDNLTGCSTFDDGLRPSGGYTLDLAINKVPGRLVNITTNQENTSPTPYCSGTDGTWDDKNTWARPDVWDFPNSTFDGTSITWNIARTRHNITSEGKNIIMLGLLSDGGLLSINTHNLITITHYLLLDGNMDLVGESQLLQDHGSILDNASGGWLERDQQGKKLSFNYNYWSSPVNAQGDTNNFDYTIRDVLLDGTDSSNPAEIDFQSAYAAADGGPGAKLILSTYWMFKFKGYASLYADWEWIGADEPINTGEGYTLKGTDGNANIDDQQNYTFKGKPHNGNITLDFSGGDNHNYLIGNPYPSALDANQFIEENIGGSPANSNFNGTLYFWSHFAGQSHYLQQYIGGYAAYNLSGGIEPASSVDQRIDNSPGTNGQPRSGGKRPEKFIPVGQGFFVNKVISSTIGTDGELEVVQKTGGGSVFLNNTQRAFETEAGYSVFHSQEKKIIQNSGNNKNSQDQMKIWLMYKSPLKYHRQLLVTADPKASSGFDLGYDAPLIEDIEEDMYWAPENYKFVIQGVNNFDLDQELNLEFKVKEKGPVVISIDELKNIPDELNIFIRDSLLQVTHDLRAEDYVVESEAGIFSDRFKLVFQDRWTIEQPETPILEDGPIQVIYVNDSREILIKNPELLDISRVYLNNMLGQQVHVYYNIPPDREIPLPVQRFSSGVYIVKLHTENGIITKKVILE